MDVCLGWKLSRNFRKTRINKCFYFLFISFEVYFKNIQLYAFMCQIATQKEGYHTTEL